MTFSIFAPVAAAMLALPATPVQPCTDLTLTVDHGSGPAVRVDLRCDPPEGSHPDPYRACRTLSSVDGDFTRLPHESVMCTEIWQPVFATATGRWLGEPVRFTHTYPNPCQAAAQSSGIFGF
ncbi:SSI family serine proteinase inhibitor [Amycolatopsis taiwanensis]|uniref:SSI family serine proteinase inhibitor n=1 Tax=Amycolatopsis taiwanensis TaxID=342230 RepID=UPI000486D8EF|nr:SSI family serine proteinase inhibitor [Amycolatopsis taiwanensis]